MIRRLITLVRQMMCWHQFRISCIRRVEPNRVECTCDLCGKTFNAPYGLALPGSLRQ